MIRVLVVDDRPEIRFGLRLRLCAEKDMTVVGDAADGPGAIAAARRLAPDVILMDVEMPPEDGIEVAKVLRQLQPDIPIIFLTIHDNEPTRRRASGAGSCGFVSKEDSIESLLLALREAARH